MTNDPFIAVSWFGPAELRQISHLATEVEPFPSGAYKAPEDYRICTLRRLTDDRLTRRVLELFRFVNERCFGFTITHLAEALQHITYPVGGHYGWHSDRGVDPPRKLSLTVQLSHPAEYDGGALEVWSGKDPVTAPRTLGACVLFPSYALHRVTPVTRGLRRALVVWAHGPEFK